ILAREVNGVKRNELSEWILCNESKYLKFAGVKRKQIWVEKVLRSLI
ncbi:MAG: hypothetical protein ACD_7C00462G0001, partial [uncultured bacterium]